MITSLSKDHTNAHHPILSNESAGARLLGIPQKHRKETSVYAWLSMIPYGEIMSTY